MLPAREEISLWLDAEKARLEQVNTGLGYWFHPEETSGFGVSLLLFHGVTGEFHVSDDGSVTLCWSKGNWPEDEIGDSGQATGWQDVKNRFASFLATANQMDAGIGAKDRPV